MKQKGKEETTVNCSASWSLICLYGATNADNGPHQITHTMQIEKDDDETSEKLLPGIVFVIYIVSMWMRRPKTLNNTRFQYSFHWFFGEIDLYQMYAPRNRINNETKETKWSTELLKLDSAPPPLLSGPVPPRVPWLLFRVFGFGHSSYPPRGPSKASPVPFIEAF